MEKKRMNMTMTTKTTKQKKEAIDREYCRKMSVNIDETTKGKIIPMVKAIANELHKEYDTVRILDVGCANGALTYRLRRELPEYVDIIGIEPNHDRYLRAKVLEKKGLKFKNDYFNPFFVDEFQTKHGLADIVLFSSVMHEIASDGDNGYGDRYTPTPIINALRWANDVLSHNGYVIVRDFIKQSLSEERYVTAQFANQGIREDLKKFLSIRRAPLLGQASALKIPSIIREDILMEFLMCETWGPDNWDREVLEKKLIMEPSQWTEAFHTARFELTESYSSSEDYPSYFSKLVKIEEPKDWKWPDFTFVKAGRKMCVCQ